MLHSHGDKFGIANPNGRNGDIRQHYYRAEDESTGRLCDKPITGADEPNDGHWRHERHGRDHIQPQAAGGGSHYGHCSSTLDDGDWGWRVGILPIDHEEKTAREETLESAGEGEDGDASVSR